jgi:alpha-tubulin suppressor-like RCC1 family protein
MSIVVLSIYFMMVRENAMQPIKVIQTTRYSREKKFHFSDCKCWRSGAGVEYAIITTTPGNVRLVNLQNGEYFKVKAKTSLGKCYLLSENGPASSRPSTWLLIESPGHGFYRLLIGHYLDSGKYEDLAALGAAQKPEFQFFAVTFGKSQHMKIFVQQTSRGSNIITFDPDTRSLQVLDVHLRLLYKYTVNATGDVRSVHLTEKLIFALTATSSDSSTAPNKLLVLSRILSEEKRQPVPPYQEFTLPAFEAVRGVFLPSFARISSSLAPISSPPRNGSSSPRVESLESPKTSGKTQRRKITSIRSYVEVSPASLMRAAHDAGEDHGDSSSSATSSSPSTLGSPGGKELFSYARTRVTQPVSENRLEKKELPVYFDEREEQEYEETYVEANQVEGAFFWTDDALYELAPVATPEQLFFRFIERVENKQGEALGMTFALDVCKLYELAADEHFRKGNLGGAQTLYHLSNVSTPKFIRQWLSVGRMDEPISTLRVMLTTGAKLGEARRPRVANELIRCHVQRLLNPSKQANLKRLLNVNERSRDEELENFLKNNPDFQDSEMRAFFCRYGLIRFALIVAQAKRHLKKSLEQLAVQRGISYLSTEHLRFISENNAMDSGSLKIEDANTLLSHFPPKIQLLHHLTAVSNIPNSMPRIQNLLGELDDEGLSQICSFFDPQGPFVGPMLSSSSHISSSSNPIGGTSANGIDSKDSLTGVPLSSSPSSRSAFGGMGSPSVGVQGGNTTGKNAGYFDPRQFVSQCVELFLTALIRLNKDHSALPQSWKPPALASKSQESGFGLSTLTDSSSATQSTSVVSSPNQMPSLDLSSASMFTSDGVPLSSESGPASASLAGTDSGANFDSRKPSPSHRNQQSGGGSQEPAVLSPRKPLDSQKKSRGLKTRKAIAVSCGFHHTALLTENGQVFTWGAGSKGQLGHENVSDTLWVPKLVAGLSYSVIGEKIIKVVCGGNHTLALSKSGTLYSFGSNARGQLGLGDRNDRVEPRQVIMDESIRSEMGTIVDFAAGFWHSVLVTEKGVWAAGANSSHAATALHSELGDQLFFTPVSNVPAETFISVKCGFGHTALLTKRGRVYTFGSNEHGQLGLGHLTASDSPQHVRGILEDKHIIDIACGSFSTFAVSEVYSCYAWGLSSKNRLGTIGPSQRKKDIPRPNSPATRPAAADFTILETGAPVLSDDDEFQEMSPIRIDALQGLEITRIFAGPSHAFATSADGNISVWGDCNTPMKAKTAEPKLPAAITPWTDSRVIAFGCGDDFTVAIMENGLVYTFGRGMCGQLGHNDQNDVFIAKQAFLNTSIMVEDKSSNEASSSGLGDSNNLKSSSSSLGSSVGGGPGSSLLNDHGRSLGDSNGSSRRPSAVKSSGFFSSIEEEASMSPGTKRDSGDLSQSSILHSGSSIATYTDPLLLEQSLVMLARKYRPSVILHQCTIAGNLAAASLILEQCGAWGASIDCKIRLLQQEFPKIDCLSHQTHLLTELLKDLDQPHVPRSARQEGLKQVLSLWKQVGGSISTLESLLSGSSLVPALAALIQSGAPASSSPLAGLPFSPKFYLQVVKSGLEEQKKNIARPVSIDPKSGTAKQPKTSIPISKDPMWADRRVNLEKDIKVRTKIQISQPALEDYIQHTKRASPSGSGFHSLQTGDVAFSCGHLISEQRFTQSTLPLFRDKMAKFPVPLPLTVKLLVSDWQLSSFQAACPPCVYNHLRDKHAPNLERWNPL